MERSLKTILFVCTANICRSPMAAAILQDRIAKAGLDAEVQAISAGVWAQEGARASANSAAVLRSRGINLEDHRSQPLTPALLRKADVVLVMEEAHRRSIFYLAPEHLAKVFLLSEMAGGNDDVSDPFGGPFEEYVETADLLAALIDLGMPKILKRAGVISGAARDTSGA